MKNKYRFDDAYDSVYKYDKDSNSYIFHGSYFAYGIDSDMGDEEKFREVEEQDLMED